MQAEKRVLIEPPAPADVEGLYGLLREAGLPLDGLDAHLSGALVAKVDGQVVGSAGVEQYGAAGLLRSVAVRESLRGTGLGRQLVEAVQERARAAGIARLYLLTETAAEWFPRFGFTPIPRSAVEPAVQASVEFTSACPASAQAMLKNLE